MSVTMALIGNPNCGKTTLFNKLTGANQRVGNWPGVTIDKKTGRIHGHDIDVVDLPGIYSLSPYSPEEIVSRDFLLHETPDVVVNIVDATNIERNLFLTLQVLDLGIPTVIALNMMDQVEKLGDKVDVDRLSKSLGCPVVPISALKNKGIDELVAKVERAAASGHGPDAVEFDRDIEDVISSAVSSLGGRVPKERSRFSAVTMVEKDERVCGEFPDTCEAISSEVEDLERRMDDEMDSIMADARYNLISDIVGQSLKRAPRDKKGTLSDRVDRVVTSRIWGIPIFLGVLSIVFLGIIGFSWGDFSITGIGTYFTDWLNGFIEDPIQSGVAEWCASIGVSEAMTSLLVDGVIGGVGAVIGFLPQMLVLFLALCILEDIGYMSRIAFVMDRVFRHFGLSGKSLIPILVGTGCGVPGIMASRTIESERDRRITAMTVTFIPCGAKLPVIAMITSAIFGGNGLVAVFSYVLGIVVILISGIILKKFRRLSGEATPFIMELPPYHIPSAVNVIKGTLDRGWAFVKKAGTIILLASIVIWVLSSYTWGLQYNAGDINDSILASIGHAISYVFMPLGWGDNWELSVGTITGLIAKENVIGTFGTLFGIEAGESGEGLEAVLGTMLSSASGLSFLAFNLICAPCFAAIGAMHRELGSWKSTGMAVAYQCVMAYAVALIIYGILGCIDGWNTIMVDGVATDLGVPVASTVAAIIVLAVMAYVLWAKDPFRQLHDGSREASE